VPTIKQVKMEDKSTNSAPINDNVSAGDITQELDTMPNKKLATIAFVLTGIHILLIPIFAFAAIIPFAFNDSGIKNWPPPWLYPIAFVIAIYPWVQVILLSVLGNAYLKEIEQKTPKKRTRKRLARALFATIVIPLATVIIFTVLYFVVEIIKMISS
jgi:hypothetical protein